MKKSKLNVNNAADEALKKLKNIYIHIYIYIKLKGSAWGVRAVLSVCNSSSGPHHTKSKNKKKTKKRKKKTENQPPNNQFGQFWPLRLQFSAQ